ncbi:hypothetical protein T492DRAFT_1120566, partial [Pavlovales sp. CCMP2436]
HSHSCLLARIGVYTCAACDVAQRLARLHLHGCAGRVRAHRRHDLGYSARCDRGISVPNSSTLGHDAQSPLGLRSPNLRVVRVHVRHQLRPLIKSALECSRAGTTACAAAAAAEAVAAARRRTSSAYATASTAACAAVARPRASASTAACAAAARRRASVSAAACAAAARRRASAFAAACATATRRRASASDAAAAATTATVGAASDCAGAGGPAGATSGAPPPPNLSSAIDRSSRCSVAAIGRAAASPAHAREISPRSSGVPCESAGRWPLAIANISVRGRLLARWLHGGSAESISASMTPAPNTSAA